MKPIQLLDTLTINQIAAGEVVERPASVVKELVENSIDAGASAVTVEIKEGGISLIRVTDNGSGIVKEQAKTAFLRHATSKISSINDISNIYSLGFRGEALASIASVAQVELTTKTANDLTGKHMELSGGDINLDEEVGCPNGTTFIVKNLFFNTPARHKFLKKPATEAGYISDMMTRLAIGHPEVSFKFINNGNIALHTSGNNNLKNVLLNVYGKDYALKLIDIENQQESLKLHGVLGKPELSRANRAYQHFFINGRWIKNDLIRNAVEEAYRTRIMIGKFPSYVLNLSIAADEYDVNVHPAKLEVRFDDEDRIYNFVYESVTETLQKQNLIPKVMMEVPKKEKEADSIQVIQQEINTKNIKPLEIIKPNTDIKTKPVFSETKLNFDNENEETKIKSFEKEVEKINNGVKIEYDVVENELDCEINETEKEYSGKEEIESKIEELSANISEKSEEKENIFTDYRIIGQIFNTYWILEQGKSMYMLDQHALHERILFEKLKKEYSQKSVVSQLLLIPLPFKVSLKEKQIIEDNMQVFEQLGFQVESFGEDSYVIRSVPIIFNKPEGTDFFMEILDTLQKMNLSSPIDLKLDRVATISCKAAVKGNNKLTVQEAERLINDFMKLENPFNCPHGRPTVIEISKYDIEKMFKRIQ